eukprot:TRINITY_DN8187_c0_g1_i2.p1 TRINITY_DN8187_c0_g1~~TRINITY_DN8187_c0_g1_i2.p1  ORF type:complete len:175 (+),score=39.25 TRINITY_DN8187_c0_g1_i2:131-655(+)
MIQRFGRTGRRQEGKVVLLLCEDEEKKYNKMQRVSKDIYKILKKSCDASTQRTFSFYDLNPRMIREGIDPTCVYAASKEDLKNDKPSSRKSKAKSVPPSLKTLAISEEAIEEKKETGEDSLSEILEEAWDLIELDKRDLPREDSFTSELISQAAELIAEPKQGAESDKKLKLYT